MRRLRGFTLIELLVAVALFALIGVLGYRGLDSVQRSASHVSREAERWQEIALVVERFGRDVRQATLRAGRQANGESAPAWWGRPLIGDAPGDAQLVFTRIGHEEREPQRLGYRWRQDQLELLTWPAPQAQAAPRSHPLLQGVQGMELAYLDQAGNWQPAWPPVGSARLPRAVRLRLKLAEGEVERVFDLPGEG